MVKDAYEDVTKILIHFALQSNNTLQFHFKCCIRLNNGFSVSDSLLYPS